MPKSLKRILWILFIGFGILVYTALSPALVPFFPRCFFYGLTGYRCPGCGSQRALHSLLHGDVGTAFSYNAFLLIVLVLMVVWTVLRGIGPRLGFSFSTQNLRSSDKIWLCLGTVALTVLWTVLRNVYGW